MSELVSILECFSQMISEVRRKAQLTNLRPSDHKLYLECELIAYLV